MQSFHPAARTIGLVIIGVLALALLDSNSQVVTRCLGLAYEKVSNFGLDRKESARQDPVPLSDSNDDWGTRIQKALFGFIVGIFLFIFSIMFTFGVERFAVKFSFILGRAKRACVPNVTTEKINKNLNCRMIHVNGQMSAEPGICDDELGYHADGTPIVLKRTVEVLQWHEKKHEHKDSCTYTYSLKWTETNVDSSGFQEQQGHTNPPRAIPIKTKSFFADTRVGAYRMSPEQLHKLKRFHVSELTPEAAAAASAVLRQPPEGYVFAGLRDGLRNTRVEGQAAARGDAYWSSIYDEHANLPRKFLYVARATPPGANTDSLGAAGDMRISYDVVREGPVSLAGVLQDDSFRAFTERDAHTTSGRFAEQLLPAAAADPAAKSRIPAGTGCCGGFCAVSAWAVDRMIAAFMDSEAPEAVLLVEERAADVASLFRDEDTKFHTRLAMMRATGALLLWLAVYLVLNPVATLLSFLPLVGGFLQGLFAIAALLLAAVVWATVAAVAWFASHPHGVMLLLLAEAASLYVRGARIDGVPLGTWVPIAARPAGDPASGIDLPGGAYVPDTVLGELLALAALLPAMAAVLALVEEARFRLNVARLNREAGL